MSLLVCGSGGIDGDADGWNSQIIGFSVERHKSGTSLVSIDNVVKAFSVRMKCGIESLSFVLCTTSIRSAPNRRINKKI